jgi:uncharacterized protein
VIRIGLLSVTHCSIPPAVKEFFKDCNEIWHAGDIGDEPVIKELSEIAPVRAVYGNIDGGVLRTSFQEHLVFDCENVRVYITHIGGYPGHYDRRALPVILREKPGLFICGHSHILKVIYDQKHKLLHINPGAAGKSGWHKSITMMRFNIEGDRIQDLEIYDIPRSGRTREMEST